MWSATATPLAFAAMPGAAKAVDFDTLYAPQLPMALTLDYQQFDRASRAGRGTLPAPGQQFWMPVPGQPGKNRLVNYGNFVKGIWETCDQAVEDRAPARSGQRVAAERSARGRAVEDDARP
jgi:hypothetical protein